MHSYLFFMPFARLMAALSCNNADGTHEQRTAPAESAHAMRHQKRKKSRALKDAPAKCHPAASAEQHAGERAAGSPEQRC